jgi:hypothetical protein
MDALLPGFKMHSQHPAQSVMAEFIKGLEPQLGSVSYTPKHLQMFGGGINDYTRRHMRNEDDSVNGFLGILSAMERRLFPAGFICGLPLRSHPQSLAWMHDRRYLPKLRRAFPSWSWVGWEGEVLFPDTLVELAIGGSLMEPRTDLTVQFVSVNGKEIVVESWMVTLDVRTKPFSEAFKSGSEEFIGSVMERNFMHNNTLASSTYNFLVVQRVTYKISEDSREKQRVFLLMLDWTGQVARRKTLVTLTLFLGGDFMQAKPARGRIRLI